MGEIERQLKWEFGINRLSDHGNADDAVTWFFEHQETVEDVFTTLQIITRYIDFDIRAIRGPCPVIKLTIDRWRCFQTMHSTRLTLDCDARAAVLSIETANSSEWMVSSRMRRSSSLRFHSCITQASSVRSKNFWMRTLIIAIRGLRTLL